MINANLLPGKPVLRPLGNKRGQTLAEYALILAFISAVAISVLIAMGKQVKVAFTTIDQQIAIAGTGAAASSAPPR